MREKPVATDSNEQIDWVESVLHRVIQTPHTIVMRKRMNTIVAAHKARSLMTIITFGENNSGTDHKNKSNLKNSNMLGRIITKKGTD